MATKLSIFNAALYELGDSPLTDTGEGVEAGRVLNAVYNDVKAECLSVGSWNFAMETIQADADTGVTPSFGYSEVFAKPSDWVRTISVSTDPDLNIPLVDYYDDANYWSAYTTPVYIRYVSDDTGLGNELTRWPATFTRYVALELASRACERLTSDTSLKERIAERRDKAKRMALNQDAMNENQPKFAPPGAWTSSRGGRSSRSDRGTRNALTS